MNVVIIALKFMLYAMAATAGVFVAVPLLIITVVMGLVFLTVFVAVIGAIFRRK